MILDTTLKTIRVVLGEVITTSNCDVTASYADQTGAGFLPGNSDTVTNGTTPVTIVTAPAQNVQRSVQEITVHNNDTVPHTVILQLDDNGTIRIFRDATVPAGGDFAYSPTVSPGTVAGTVPAPTAGTALDFIRINAAGSAYEVQTPAQTIGDIAGGVSGAINSTPVGGTTPSTGAFTTLSATSTISGAGFTAWAASPPPIGSSAPNSGAFTTLSASGAVSGAGFVTLLTPYAPLASPALTGTPTAPTAAAGVSTTQLATTAFVEATIQASGDVGRNLIHNGLFRVQQRGAGAFTANGAYTADRWLIQLSTSTVSDTIVALADADRTAIGDENAEFALQGVVGGSAGAGDFAIPAQQRIESVQRLSGKTVLISFWAKVNSGTPKVGIELFQNFGSGGSPSSQVTGIGAQAITLSTTWTRYTTTAIAVPSASGKTFGSTANTDYTGLNFWCSSGATNATRASSIGNQSFTLDVWGVQIEVVPATATLATQLEKPDPRYELANCQRFYNSVLFWLAAYSTTGASIGYDIPYPTQMRAAPSTVLSGSSYVNASGASVGSATQAGVIVSALVTATGAAIASISVASSADL